MTEPSLAELREMLQVFADSDLSDLHIEVGGVRMRASKGGALAPEPAARAPGSPAPAAVPAPQPAAEPATAPPPAVAAPAPAAGADGDDIGDVTGLAGVVSPAVGIFYRRPAPDQPSYVEVGDTVSADTPVCTIEVMKMFTEVLAGCAGTVERICVDNATLVEHGQVLVYIRPASA